MSEAYTLFSYTGCPFCLRARMALACSDIKYHLVEVDLNNKPLELFELSEKGTVPIFKMGDDTVIDESLDIIQWAREKNENGWMDSPASLVRDNDDNFVKPVYRYAKSGEKDALLECLKFLDRFEDALKEHPYIVGNKISPADIAIFPFVKRFADKHPDWKSLKYKKIQSWHNRILDSDFYKKALV